MSTVASRRHAGGHFDRNPLSGARLTVALATIVSLTVLPFVVGSAISVNRAVQARRDVACLAEELRLPFLTTTAEVQVLQGEGNVPRGDSRSLWFRAVGSLDRELEARGGSECSTRDPWRQAYLVNVGTSGPVWVVSAGANGIVETVFGATGPAGDDIGFRVRYP